MKSDQNKAPNFGRVAQAWEKWEDWLAPCYFKFNERLLDLAQIGKGQSVLDLGCGSGQPAILESQKVGFSGQVIALDIAAEMLAVATQKAASLGVQNIQFLRRDMDTLPFPENSFDAVTARFSLMFVPEPRKTLQEIHRVLRPGRSFACSVWASADDNPLPRTILRQFAEVPGNDPSTPGPFRFGNKEELPNLMKETGFDTITQDQTNIGEKFLSGEHYVEHLLEASALWGGLLLELPPDQKAEAIALLASAAEAKREADRVVIPRCAWLLSGRKP